MADKIQLNLRLGHAMNMAMFAGDIETVMVHLGKYLADNEIKIPRHVIVRMTDKGLIEPT